MPHFIMKPRKTSFTISRQIGRKGGCMHVFYTGKTGKKHEEAERSPLQRAD
jgi:hypothetical protein